MQKCKNCKQEFSFRQIYKSFWLGYRPIECDHCKTKYEHSFGNRWLGGLSVGLGVFLGGLVQSYLEISMGYRMLIGALVTIFVVILFSGLLVSYLKFEKEEKKNYT